MWIRQLLRDLQEPIEKSTPIFMDNQSAIKLVHNAEFHKQIADISTKPIPRNQFEILRNMLSVKKM